MGNAALESADRKSANSPILMVERLSLTLGKSKILEDISFLLHTGELLAIVGPNGAGKTSTLKSLLGIYPADWARAEVGGKPLSRLSALQLARYVSYLPQQEERLLDFRVSEFVEMSLYSQGDRFGFLPASEKKVNVALERVGMLNFSERRLTTLSGGELRKVYLAGALAQDARVILLDEPTSFLDPRHQAEVIRILIDTVKKASVGAIFVTHDLNLALWSADRIIALKDGRKIFDGAPEDFCSEQTLQRVYDIHLRIGRDSQTGRPFILPSIHADYTGAGRQPL